MQTFQDIVKAYWSEVGIAEAWPEIEILLRTYTSLPPDTDPLVQSSMLGYMINVVFQMGREQQEKERWVKRLKWLSRKAEKRWPDSEE